MEHQYATAHAIVAAYAALPDRTATPAQEALVAAITTDELAHAHETADAGDGDTTLEEMRELLAGAG